MLRKVFFLIFIGAVGGAAVTLVTPQSRTVIEGSSAKAAAVEAFQQLSLFAGATRPASPASSETLICRWVLRAISIFEL